MSNKLIATLLLVLTCAGLAYSGIITRPTKTTGGTSYSDGTVPHASDFNGDMDTIYNEFNGNITNANVSGGAAIAGSKIATSFTTNVQVTSAAVPCFVNIDSSLGADLKQWRICQNAGTLSIATYTDAGSVIITPLSIVRATGNITVSNGFTLSAGNLTLNSGTITATALTAKSFLFSGAGGLLSTTSAPTNGQMLIGNTGNNPTLGTIAGTATHVCTATGAGTFTLDFCANPAITAPVFSGTATGSLTNLALTTPVFTGTITGSYALGGTLAAIVDSSFRIAGSGDVTKLLAFEVDGLTGSTTRTITVPNADLTLPAVSTGNVIYGSSTGVMSGLTIGAKRDILLVNSAGTLPVWEQRIVQNTLVSTTSGTTVDFTGIPANVGRITFTLKDVSTNGTSALRLRLGDSGGIETTGYNGGVSSISASNVWGTGIELNTASVAAGTYNGVITLTLNLTNANSITWFVSGQLVRNDSLGTFFMTVGNMTGMSPGPLDRVRITTVNGTDTFDGGEINVAWE